MARVTRVAPAQVDEIPQGRHMLRDVGVLEKAKGEVEWT